VSEEALRFFIENVPDYAIFMLDPEGRVATWNAGAERIKGWAADEIVGQHFSRFYPAEDVARGKPAAELEIASREGSYEDEGWRVRKDGSLFWASVVINAVRSPQGELLGFGKVTRDLTQRRKMEERRLALAAREEGLRAREELLVVTAHELRTPIAALQLHAELVRRAVEREGAPGERFIERVKRLQHSATRLSRLVDAVLRVATLEPRQVVLERRTLDLREVVERVIQEHGADIASAGCEVGLEAGPPAVVTGDRPLLDVLVTNLLANALKYGARQPVSFRVELHGDRATITVADRGIGIAAERQPTLFGRFSRGVSSRHYGGLGLGLWTVRTIAEAHGGAVRVSSQAGRGATFEVELPARAKAPAQAH
jgi:PAS domain S-box-containing protein